MYVNSKDYIFSPNFFVLEEFLIPKARKKSILRVSLL